MEKIYGVEFRITSVDYIVDEDRRRKSKIRTKYLRYSDITGTAMELDALFKRARIIRFDEEVYKVDYLSFDVTKKVFRVSFLPIDTTTYKSYKNKEKPFNPDGWSEIGKEELSSASLPAPRKPKIATKIWDEDEGYDDDN